MIHPLLLICITAHCMEQLSDTLTDAWFPYIRCRCNLVFSQTMDVRHMANTRYASVMSLNHHDQVQSSWRTCTGVAFRTTVFSQRLPCSHKSSQLSDRQSAHGQHEICFYHEFKSTRLKAQLLVDMLDVRTFQVYTIFVPVCQVQEESRINTYPPLLCWYVRHNGKWYSSKYTPQPITPNIPTHVHNKYIVCFLGVSQSSTPDINRCLRAG